MVEGGGADIGWGGGGGIGGKWAHNQPPDDSTLTVKGAARLFRRHGYSLSWGCLAAVGGRGVGVGG